MKVLISRMSIGILLSPLILSNTSCQSLDSLTDKMAENKETLIGSLAGTAAGATIGGLVAKKKGAMIGGAVGLVSGAMIGNYYAKQERTRTQTTASVGYRPEQGNLLTITEATAAPSVAKQGESVKVNTKYTILRPDEDKATIKETREVRCNGTLVDTQTAEVRLDQGEQRITWEYPIPHDAKAGTYQVLTTAAIDEKQSSATTSFAIK
ncbi:MAG: glycine zipper domain-containing protein [Nitrospirota bacterium]|nr:glycine zipper domain-containing protein [Nitrospirota bacterium]